jgi:SAM-dependent methyltransferase
MNSGELKRWFAEQQAIFEPAYLSYEEPWRQSGFSGPEERWVACRKPIAGCVTSDGTFLDIGCANGYLIECLLEWTRARGLTIEPWGLDVSAALVELARQRCPEWAADMIVGNAFRWRPPRRFDYVRTELCYVPDECRRDYVLRLLDEFIAPGGRLLVCEYRSRNAPPSPWVEDDLRRMGLPIESSVSDVWEGQELTRVVVIPTSRRAAAGDR